MKLPAYMTTERGASLIEAMLGLVLLSISLLGVVGMMVYFSTNTSDKALRSCLLESASNALEQYKVDGLPVITDFTCGNASGTITMSHGTYPAASTCNDVTSTATVGARSMTLQTRVCNFQ